MADEDITDVKQTTAEANVAEPVGAKPKSRTPRKRAEPKPAKTPKGAEKATKAAAVEPETGRRRIKKYSPAQRAALLASIEKATSSGKTTLKAALQQADVREQTYYNWKNAAAKAAAPTSKASSGDDLSALVALEAENMKLRQELAAKLRAENAELRKRLGRG